MRFQREKSLQFGEIACMMCARLSICLSNKRASKHGVTLRAYIHILNCPMIHKHALCTLDIAHDDNYSSIFTTPQFQNIMGDPMLSQQEVRLKEMIEMLYESAGKIQIFYKFCCLLDKRYPLGLTLQQCTFYLIQTLNLYRISAGVLPRSNPRYIITR